MRGDDAGQVRRAAGTRNDDLEAPFGGTRRIRGSVDRRPVRRTDARFVRDAEPCQHLVGVAHRLPVRFASHQDSNQRLRL
jgi:hypothetical protein